MFKPIFKAVLFFALIALVSACAPATTPVSVTSTEVPSPTTRPTQTLPIPTSTPLSPGISESGLIAFYSERDGNAEIYTIHADGSAETRLTQNRALDTAPDISPGGTQIVFVSDRDGNEEIYRMNSDGSDVRRLTTEPAKDSYPFWSADGARIIFCSQRDDGRTYEVYLMNSDGTDPIRITHNSVSEEWAYLSPDMQKIVYAVGPFPRYSLYVMNVDGSDPRQIFSSDKSAAFPKWSRDGKTIACNHAALSAGRIVGDIGLMNGDGSNFRQITQTGAGFVSEGPYWSPDGSRIVFQSNRTGNFQIYVMNADGSDPVRLTNHHGNDYYPSWGPVPAPPEPTLLSLRMGPQRFTSRDTFQVALGDVDGDGDLDAVFSNMGPRHSQVWLNDGSGFFVDSGQELTQQGHGAALGDLDGDGDLDLFISCASYSANGVEYYAPSKVYLNDGTGVFRDSGQDLGDTELSGNSVDLIDIDTDGDLDASVMYHEQPYKIYLNDGRGSFAESDLTLPSEAVLAWGDLDGDGDVDLLLKEHGQGYRVMLNDGAGNLTDHWRLDDGHVIWGGATLGDLDGDGDLDAVIANGDNDNSYPTIVLLNDGTGRFSDSGQQLSITRWGEIGLEDLDGDGDLDAFITNFQQPDEVWLNDGRGYFHDSGLWLGGNSPSRGCAFGDLDADGDIDVLVASFGSVSNVIWLNDR
jgi:hypothetical protein